MSEGNPGAIAELHDLIGFLSRDPGPHDVLRYLCHNTVIDPAPRGGMLGIVSDRARVIERGSYGLPNEQAARDLQQLWHASADGYVGVRKKPVRVPFRPQAKRTEPATHSALAIPLAKAHDVPIAAMLLVFRVRVDEPIRFRVNFTAFRQLLAIATCGERLRGDTHGRDSGQYPLEQPLTDREAAVLVRVARGLTNPLIASELNIGLSTVKRSVASLYRKLDVHTREDLGRVAIRHRLVTMKK